MKRDSRPLAPSLARLCPVPDLSLGYVRGAGLHSCPAEWLDTTNVFCSFYGPCHTVEIYKSSSTSLQMRIEKHVFNVTFIS